MMRVGFIGLGSQGAPMARMIASAGYPLTLWARRAASLAPLADVAASSAGSPAELAAACDLVGLCVFNDDDVREVALAGGLLAAMPPGSILAIHSTVHPDTCQEIAAAAPRGVEVLDAPVSGSGEAALQRRLAVMVGGDAAAFEAARPVFETFGAPVRRMGPLGTGQLCKLVNNILLTANLKLAADAMSFGRGLGIEHAALHEMLMASSGRSFALDAGERMIRPAVADHVATLFRKDLDLAMEAAARAGLDISVLRDVARRTIADVEALAR